MADFSTIVSDVERYVGRSDDTVNVRKAVNAAVRRIEAVKNWYWMEETAELPLASADPVINRIILPDANPPGIFKDLRDPVQWRENVASAKTWLPLLPISEEEANYIYNTDASGDPERYRLWKNQMFLYPAARTINILVRLPYWKWSPTLAGTDTHELITRWSELLIARSCIEHMKSNRDFKGAAYWTGDARNPQPGTYLYELAMLSKYTNKRALPPSIGVKSTARPTARISQGYPWWNR